MKNFLDKIKTFLLTYLACIIFLVALMFLIVAIAISDKTRIVALILFVALLIPDIILIRRLMKYHNEKTKVTFEPEKKSAPQPISKTELNPQSSQITKPSQLETSHDTHNTIESQQYIINNNTIEEIGEEITNDDIPYLIELSYQEALTREAKSINPKFHRTPDEEELSFNFSQKYSKQISSLESSFKEPYRDEQKTYNHQDKISLLELALTNFEKAKQWCYSKGKGGQLYFDDMWMNLHNSQCECFPYSDLLLKRLVFIKSLASIRQQILDIVNNTPEILQKEIYSFFKEEQKDDVIYALKDLVKDNCLLKEKHGNSYALTALVKKDIR